MDPLIEIRTARVEPKQSPISNEVSQMVLESFSVSWNRLWAAKSAGGATFYGPAARLKCKLGEIESPLVYLYKGKLSDALDASVIETGLPVASGTAVTEELPYWPSYRGASPTQRARYLSWLLDGRTDPEMPIGYVFIYFYGLERRVLIDKMDHSAIATELLRLLTIYSQSRPFVKYATGLLWTTAWLSLNHSSISDDLLDQAIRQTSTWSEETLGLCLACLAKRQERLTVGMAYRLASNDLRAPRSVVVQRHPELHRESFRRKFATDFPEGMMLMSSQRDRHLEYFPASATLGRLHDAGGPLADERVLNVIGLSGQFEPLIRIWTESVEELKAYDRAHRKSGTADTTAAMFESLPEDLRQGEHPHFDAWYEVMQRFTSDDGWTVTTVSELARIEGITERKRLTKTQSLKLAGTATHMGLALEPDPRITAQSYTWTDAISVFPVTEELGDDVSSYHAAAILLELGLAIAAADGHIDEIELGRLSAQLESQFELSSQDSVRLDHLRYLLVRQPPREFSAGWTLQKKLTVAQRQLVGEFLVGVAAADEHIAAEEVNALRKAYRALGLNAFELDRLLKSVESDSKEHVAAESFQLDMNRINAIMAETAKVSIFLREALREDAEDGDYTTEVSGVTPQGIAKTESEASSKSIAVLNVTSDDSRFVGLQPHFIPFAAAAIMRQTWSRTELESLARSHGLMLGAAMEAINDWSYDALSDALFADSDLEILIQYQLLP